MANLCPNIGVLLGCLSVIGIIYTLASKEWKRNSQVSSQSHTIGLNSYEGLWIRCTSSSAGVIQCDNYDTSYLALPASLQAQRAMMVIATIAGVIGIIAGTVGLECVNAMKGTKGKGYTRISGGGLIILAGILTIAAVSWYATGVVQDFHNTPANTQFVYEFGSALYIGWISGGLALVAGALLACCNCSGGGDNVDSYHYSYRPPQSNKPGAKPAEYV